MCEPLAFAFDVGRPCLVGLGKMCGVRYIAKFVKIGGLCRENRSENLENAK